MIDEACIEEETQMAISTAAVREEVEQFLAAHRQELITHDHSPLAIIGLKHRWQK